MFGKFIMCFPLRLTTTITVVVATTTTTITNTTTIVKSESVSEQKHQQHARILGEKQRKLYTLPCKNTHKCRCYSSQIRDILCVRARFSTHTYTTNSSQCLRYFGLRSLYVSMRSFACYFFLFFIYFGSFPSLNFFKLGFWKHSEQLPNGKGIK